MSVNDFAVGGEVNNWLKQFQGDDPSNNMFLDLLPFDSINLKKLTPFQPGRGYFIPTLMPRMMKAKFSTSTKLFRVLMTSYATDITGFSNMSMETSQVESGVESQNLEVANKLTGIPKELTFKFPAELKGQFISRFIQHWLFRVADPNTGDKATYPHELDMDYDNANHTINGIYFTLDPSETKVVKAFYMYNMMPKEIPLDLNDKTRGDHAVKEVSVSFGCQVLFGNRLITQLANNYLSNIRSTIYGATDKYDRFVNDPNFAANM